CFCTAPPPPELYTLSLHEAALALDREIIGDLEVEERVLVGGAAESARPQAIGLVDTHTAPRLAPQQRGGLLAHHHPFTARPHLELQTERIAVAQWDRASFGDRLDDDGVAAHRGHPEAHRAVDRHQLIACFVDG